MRHAAGMIAKSVPRTPVAPRQKRRGGPGGPPRGSDRPKGQKETRAPTRIESGSCQPLFFM